MPAIGASTTGGATGREPRVRVCLSGEVTLPGSHSAVGYPFGYSSRPRDNRADSLNVIRKELRNRRGDTAGTAEQRVGESEWKSGESRPHRWKRCGRERPAGAGA